MLPGWYGFGSAVEGWLADHPGGRDAGAALLREMHERWQWWRTTVMNMEMVLAKTDSACSSGSCRRPSPGARLRAATPLPSPLTAVAIAARYGDLVTDAAVRDAVLPRLLAEHALTIAHVLAVRGQPSLLHDQPRLEASLRARWPYCDPLNHLQARL